MRNLTYRHTLAPGPVFVNLTWYDDTLIILLDITRYLSITTYHHYLLSESRYLSTIQYWPQGQFKVYSLCYHDLFSLSFFFPWFVFAICMLWHHGYPSCFYGDEWWVSYAWWLKTSNRYSNQWHQIKILFREKHLCNVWYQCVCVSVSLFPSLVSSLAMCMLIYIVCLLSNRCKLRDMKMIYLTFHSQYAICMHEIPDVSMHELFLPVTCR